MLYINNNGCVGLFMVSHCCHRMGYESFNVVKCVRSFTTPGAPKAEEWDIGGWKGYRRIKMQ